MTTYDLRRLKIRSGDQHREEVEVELAPLEFGGQRYVPVPERVPAALTVTQASTGKVFELELRARLHGPCQRCLGDAVVERDLALREYQATDPQDDDELATPYVTDTQILLGEWARDAVALSLPDQILCRPDCAGLCPTCGKDLNAEPHVHEEEAVDPRWEALAKLRDEL